MTLDKLIEQIRSMDERQMLNLMHDIEDLGAIERLADCAYHYLENYEGNTSEISEIQDWQHQDDLQRTRDINSA